MEHLNGFLPSSTDAICFVKLSLTCAVISHYELIVHKWEAWLNTWHQSIRARNHSSAPFVITILGTMIENVMKFFHIWECAVSRATIMKVFFHWNVALFITVCTFTYTSEIFCRKYELIHQQQYSLFQYHTSATPSHGFCFEPMFLMKGVVHYLLRWTENLHWQISKPQFLS